MSEQRRLVSVLFADFVGSTAITLDRDPEVVRTAFGNTFAELRSVIESHGGTVEKFIGDEVMAVFGVPLAHDDDADRAVRAAFAMQRRIRELNQRPGAIALQLRIGINTGETVAGTGEGREVLVTGEPVIAAARLRAAADPGEIVMGPLTHSLTKESVLFGESRRADAKGIGRIELWPALELRSDVPATPRGVPGLRASLIGRDHELRMLRETFARVGAERSPSLVTAFGAAGSGKSRLISEFVATMPANSVRIGRCLPYGDGITFYPLQQIIRADLGIEINADRSDATARLRTAVADTVAIDERETVARALEVILALREGGEALSGLAGRDVMAELRWGVRRYLERRATRPLVLVFEDLHWAEPALLGAIEDLAEWTRAPIMLLCSARLEFRDERRSFGAHAANAVGITLSRLDREETERLVNELLRIEDLPDDLHGAITARAEGNPLYVEEFIRTLIETGQVRREGERWTSSGPRALGIPPSLQGIITARLDRVSPDARRLLQAASIVGRLFSTSALAAITGHAPSADVMLDAARRDLVVEVDERAPGEGRVYSFTHPLFRDVAYSMIPKAERAQLHANYANWLEAILGSRAEEVQEIVAYHAEQSYAYASELGDPRVETLGARALDLLIAVADRARGRGDAHAARGLYVRAAAIAEATDAPAGQRVHAIGNALVGAGQGDGMSHAELDRRLAVVLAQARELPPTEILLRLLNAAAVRAFDRRDIEATKRLTTELAQAARAIGDADLMAHWLGECAERADWWGDSEAEERFLLEALDAARHATSAFGRLMPLVRLAARALSGGDYVRAAEYELEIDAIDFSQSPLARATYLRSAGRRAYLRGEFTTAIDLVGRAIGAYRELGAPKWMVVVSLWFLGDALLADRRDDRRARDVLEEGAALAESLQMTGQMPEMRARAAIACLRVADISSARGYVDAAKRAILEDDPGADRITATAEALLALADGDSIRAELVLSEAAARIAHTADGFNVAQLQITLGEVLLAAGRLEKARKHLVRAREFFRGPIPRGWQDYIDQRLAQAGTPVG